MLQTIVSVNEQAQVISNSALEALRGPTKEIDKALMAGIYSNESV